MTLNDFRSYISHVDTLLERQQFDEAEVLLKNSIHIWGDKAEFNIAYARVATRRGDIQEAILRWTSVRKKYPGNINGHFGYANALSDSNQFDEAEAIFCEMKNKWPDKPQGFIGYARAAMRRKEWGTASRRWQTAVKLFPNSLEVITGYFYTEIEKGDLEHADKLLQKMIAACGHTLNSRVGAARIAMRKRQYIQATTYWKKAFNEFPENSDVLAGYTNALINTCQFDLAEEINLIFLGKKPVDPRACFCKAKIAHAKGKYSESVTLWKTNMARYPGHIEPYIGLADTLVDLKHNDEAEKTIHLALEKWPSNIAALHILTRIYMEEKSWADAEKLCKRILAIYPGNLFAEMNYGRSLLELGHFTKAAKISRNIIKQDDSFWGAYLLLGKAIEGKRRRNRKRFWHRL